jgi:hypothetical protein
LIEEYLTPLEVSKILKVSLGFVYKHFDEYGGKKIGKKLVRFNKNAFCEIMEVEPNARLQAQEKMDVRFLEEQCEIQAGRIPGQTGGNRSGGQSKNNSQLDKYGLRGIVRKQIERS